MTIRALVFDAYGTLYDVQSVRAQAETLCPGKGEVITHVWRLKQLEYTWLRSLLQEYEDFWAVTRASLDFALRAAGVEPNDAHMRTPDGELSPPRPLSRSTRGARRARETQARNSVERHPENAAKAGPELRSERVDRGPDQHRRRSNI